MRYFEGSDWIADVMVRLSVQITTVVRIDPNLVGQAGLVVSQDNSRRSVSAYNLHSCEY